MTMLPRIGITTDAAAERFQAARRYVEQVSQCGGVPLLLTCAPERVPEYLEICQGFIFTGGDDPIMETWNVATHPKATKVDPARQQFELALLEAIQKRNDVPVLGVCLGMQYMGLVAGGTLDQYLPDSLPSATEHWGRVEHPISGEIGEGVVQSHHRQALTDAGSLRVIGRAHDGVIEAIDHPARAFYLGVQWHPERTDNPELGSALFQRLTHAARNESSEHPNV